MRVTVNAEVQEMEPGSTVRDLVMARTGRELDEAGQPTDARPLPMAVAVGSAVLRRSEWAQRELAEGEIVDLVTAVQGG